MQICVVLSLLYPIMYSRKGSAKDQILLQKEASGAFFTRKDRVSRVLPVVIIFIVAVLFMSATIVDQVFQVTLAKIRVDTKLSNIPLFLHGREAIENFQFQEQATFTGKPNIPQNLRLNFEKIQQNYYVQDVVLLPDNEVLLLVRLPSSIHKLNHVKSSLRCSFSDKIQTPVSGIEYLEGSRAAVRCNALPDGAEWSAGTVSIVVVTGYNSDNTPGIKITDNNKNNEVIKWDFMVYQSLVTETDIVLFAKGINHKQGLIKMDVPAEYLRCLFNDTIETIVTVSAQEVFRCKQPHEQFRPHLLGSKITLLLHGQPIPSVAYYEILHRPPDPKKKEAQALLCACTMVFNVGKYLREWIMYNSYIGVEHFYIYDNNSEDSLQESIDGLNNSGDHGGYNVTRYPWPWAKTQESGFSHCALIARDKCQWMMYTDVDEFPFSHSWTTRLKGKRRGADSKLQKDNGNITSKAFNRLLMDLIGKSNNADTTPRVDRSKQSAKIGQISFKCRNFGPSGLHQHPEKGVTQGYTCREKGEQRHKSVLLLEALSPSLLNVVHHFHLKSAYRTLRVQPSKAVINHYKYQAWPEFKTKFRRRVSAYVVDWKDSKNLGSQDRTPGLDNKAVKPRGWEKRFCEVNDTALQHFTKMVFSVKNGKERDYRMQWQ